MQLLKKLISREINRVRRGAVPDRNPNFGGSQGEDDFG
jgi:hypothetical protein